MSILSSDHYSMGKLSMGNSKESICKDFNLESSHSKKVYSRGVPLLGGANGLIRNDVELDNKHDTTNKMIKTICLAALGIGAVASGGIFLANKLKFSKNIYRFIDDFSVKTYGGLCNSNERKALFKVITDCGANKTVVNQRMAALQAHPLLADRMLEGKCSNATFILDNINDFSKILTRQNRRLLGPDYSSLIETIKTKEELRSLCKTMDSPDAFKRKALETIYNSNKHVVEFGNEVVETDSSFLVHLLTGRQYYINDKEFNKMTEKLVEKSYRNGGVFYNKIAEGILKQKPELKVAISKFEAYCDNLDDIDSDVRVQKIKEFFKQLSKDGILPEKITLRTIVPDENAFAKVENTLLLNA